MKLGNEKMSNKRTLAEVEVASAIRSFLAKNGYSPSFRDVADETGMPLGTVHAICVDLAERGIISYHPRIARSLKA